MSVRTRSQTKNQTKSILKSVLKPVTKRLSVYGSRFPYKPAVIRLSLEELDEMGLSCDSCDSSGKYQIVIHWYKVEYNDFDTINIIRTSKYFKGLKMISKDKFTYFDHNFFM